MHGHLTHITSQIVVTADLLIALGLMQVQCNVGDEQADVFVLVLFHQCKRIDCCWMVFL